ncbi:hypothetical protein BST61_g4167 [Cercospora zeina]
MPVVPFSDSAISSSISSTDTTAVQQDHPHPPRSHASAADLLAQQLQITHVTQRQQPDGIPAATNVLGRSRRSGSTSSSHHRRSLARTCIDASEFHIPTASPIQACNGFPPRFRHNPSPPPTTASSSLDANFLPPPPTPRDYPIIPTRPPLRPTVSFGAVSHHSYDSTSPITATRSLQDSAMLYEKPASIEVRDAKKPTLSRKMHHCLACCFGQPDPPSP